MKQIGRKELSTPQLAVIIDDAARELLSRAKAGESGAAASLRLLKQNFQRLDNKDRGQLDLPNFKSELPPLTEQSKRHEIALKIAERVACEHNLLNEFREAMTSPDFGKHAAAWSEAFWRWIDQETPDGLRARLLDTSKLPEWCIDLYLAQRAYFLSKLRYDRSDPAGEWFRQKVRLFLEADKLGDANLFEELAKPRRGVRRKSCWPHSRLTKYYVLYAWLAGGVCHVPASDRLHCLIPLTRSFAGCDLTESAISKACSSLGLVGSPRSR